MTATITLTRTFTRVDHIEISNPDDPMGMPLYGGDPMDAHKVLVEGVYEGYGHGDGFEGPAAVRVIRSVRTGELTVRSGWKFTNDADKAARVRAEIEAEVKAINEERGTTDWRSNDRISFGYLGNCSLWAGAGRGYDDRSWSVFLPHPGRVGTYEDRMGAFSTDCATGFELLLVWVRANRRALVAYQAR